MVARLRVRGDRQRRCNGLPLAIDCGHIRHQLKQPCPETALFLAEHLLYLVLHAPQLHLHVLVTVPLVAAALLAAGLLLFLRHGHGAGCKPNLRRGCDVVAGAPVGQDDDRHADRGKGLEQPRGLAEHELEFARRHHTACGQVAPNDQVGRGRSQLGLRQHVSKATN